MQSEQCDCKNKLTIDLTDLVIDNVFLLVIFMNFFFFFAIIHTVCMCDTYLGMLQKIKKRVVSYFEIVASDCSYFLFSLFLPHV